MTKKSHAEACRGIKRAISSITTIITILETILESPKLPGRFRKMVEDLIAWLKDLKKDYEDWYDTFCR